MPDNANVNFIGESSGGGALIANRLIANSMHPGILRPYLTNNVAGNEVAFYTNSAGIDIPVHNATATLRKDEWIHLDTQVSQVARARLRAVADLRSRGLVYNLPNAMGITSLQHQNQSDIGDAGVSIDGLAKTDSDRSEFDLGNLPIPIIHKDFHFSAREIATSRNTGTPIDISNATMSARKVAEMAEKMLCGTESFNYAGGIIYGYTNFPGRLTKSLTLPTASGWTGLILVQELLAMRQQLQDQNHYGPYQLYFSSNWDAYLDEDYSPGTADSRTLRTRIQQIDGFSNIQTLDYLPGASASVFTVIMVEMDVSTVREIVGMDITTVQWMTEGGMQLNFKVMAILVPQIRADFEGQTGIIHGTAS